MGNAVVAGRAWALFLFTAWTLGFFLYFVRRSVPSSTSDEGFTKDVRVGGGLDSWTRPGPWRDIAGCRDSGVELELGWEGTLGTADGATPLDKTFFRYLTAAAASPWAGAIQKIKREGW